MTEKRNSKMSLAEAHPELAAQWHPTKNGDLTPDMVTCGSRKKVWWLLSYDDPETGQHFDFEWTSNIYDRASGGGCPYLSGQDVWSGYNDLSSKFPDLAKEWHPTKNGTLTPDKVACGSQKKVWWLLPYDDPDTGKRFNFEWSATINNRTRDAGCPFLSGKAVWPKYNDLATKLPELANEWHPTRNGALTPDKVAYKSHKRVWWFLPYDDPNTGKHFDFEWSATINNRAGGAGCPFLKNTEAWPGYNDLITKYPDLAKEWHPTKNGTLTPDKVTYGSNKKVWWRLPYDDPETGEHFDFEWETNICDRTGGRGCPFLSGRAVWPGYNDLATKFPDLAKEWHPTKNGSLTPDIVAVKSHKKVWWLRHYDDPNTGKHFDFEWQAEINHRTNGIDCPFLSGQSVWSGYNDLATNFPDLAKEWHPTKNGALMPDTVTCGSPKKVWWRLPYDDPKNGRHFDFEWIATIYSRANGAGCPFLTGTDVWPGYNDLATYLPELAAEWHPIKNEKLTPDMVTCGSTRTVWWILPYDDPATGMHFDFEWMAVIKKRADGIGCPFLTGTEAWPGYNDLASKRPDIAAEWHPTKNGNLTPDKVTCCSEKKVWWLFSYDDPETGKHFDFEWKAGIGSRTSGNGCPFLSGHGVWPGFNDLATRLPKLAAEWHPTKNGNLTPDKVVCGSPQKVWWQYAYDDPETGKHFDFEREAPINARSGGIGCPFLSGRAVLHGYNDLNSKYPDLAGEWHPTRNRRKTPQRTYHSSRQKVWWLCSKCGHEWRSAVYTRTCVDEHCPECKKRMPRYV